MKIFQKLVIDFQSEQFVWKLNNHRLSTSMLHIHSGWVIKTFRYELQTECMRAVCKIWNLWKLSHFRRRWLLRQTHIPDENSRFSFWILRRVLQSRSRDWEKHETFLVSPFGLKMIYHSCHVVCNPHPKAAAKLWKKKSNVEHCWSG